MLISTRGRYALRIMLELAAYPAGECVSLSSMAKRQNISLKYMESIIASLTRAGLVSGVRGKGGGYCLSRRPEEYTVGEILHLSEGPLAPVSCLAEGENHCARADECLTLPLWKKLDGMINGYLDSVTLADLLAQRIP